MTNPAYQVEGDLEQKFIQTICPGSPVRKINCNGDDVSLEAIGKRVGTLGRLLHKRHSPLVVVFDRERRTETSEAIEANLGNILTQEAIQVPVVVGVADRQIENWILADFQTFSASAGLADKLPPESFEGKKGKSSIKKALGKNRNYVETIDGVAWLVAARPAVIAQNSPSFRRLAAALVHLQCGWLDQGRLDL